MSELVITKDLIFSQMQGDFSQIVHTVGKRLMEQNIVKESYPEAVIQREAEYPTGLCGKYGGFAIPHTYCEHCLRSALAVVRTNPPMRFTRMDDHSSTVDCGLIVMLAIADAKEQLPMLRKLMKALQDEETFRILSSETKEELVAQKLISACQ